MVVNATYKIYNRGLKKTKLLPPFASEFIKSSTYGASIIFTGTVRNINDDKEVNRNDLMTAHEKLVLKSFDEIYSGS